MGGIDLLWASYSKKDQEQKTQYKKFNQLVTTIAEVKRLATV
jgi:hypothetical protein